MSRKIINCKRVSRKPNVKACLAMALTICLIALVGCSSNRDSPPTVAPLVQITPQSGSPQSHAVNGAFGTLLVAMVTSNGVPANGVVVTFTAPGTGASGTFGPKGTNTTTATTNSIGLATSTIFTANREVGIYTVTASCSGAATAALFDLTNTTGAPASITPTSGNGQSAAVNTSFTNPLQVSVVDSGNNPVNNATVVFTAPATGASGTFLTSSTNIATALTNASGIAVSPIFSANGVAGADTVVAAVSGTTSTASFGLTNMAGSAESVSVVSGTSQNAIGGKPFAAPLSALVVDDLQNPVDGVVVTFTAPTSAASLTFASTGTNTSTATTNSAGIATSSTMTANDLAGTFAVLASATGTTQASFTLTNYPVGSQYYSFYLSGQEDLEQGSFTGFYNLAGSVLIDPTGDVIAGEQDYSDGFFVVSPQPSGDTITGGGLTLSSTTHQGTLVLDTNNLNVGVSGVETLAVQFVNSNHALIAQYDGSATSSGSLDLQTLPTLSTSNLNGGYAFTLTGLDPVFSPVGYGGVFSIASGGTTLQNGLYDTNDAGIGAPVLGSSLTGTLSIPDAFGRGTITSTLNYDVLLGGPSPVSLNYYIVGPEVIRIIDVDPSDTAIGTAYGQGTNATTASNASLGSSIFGVEGTVFSTQYGDAGMFSTNSSSGTFTGVGDDNELAFSFTVPDATISGTYSIASTGYGSLTIAPGDLGDVSAFGLYMTDPKLNLLDPNNTTSGTGGGALLLDTDALFSGGTGIVLPQTNTSTSSFTGQYAMGAQDQNYLMGFEGEFDFVAESTVTSGEIVGYGLVSDPFLTLGADATNSDGIFIGTPLPDPLNAGRFSMLSTNSPANPLNIKVGKIKQEYNVVMYQANGDQFLWLDEDEASVFLGSLQQFGSFTTVPTASANSKSKTTQK